MSYSNCHGCSLCLLSCPMWQQHRDVQFSPQGLFKSLQHNATHAEISPALFSCLLCGACDVLCPERINITQIVKQLRQEVFGQGGSPELKNTIDKILLRQTLSNHKVQEDTVILPSKALRSRTNTLLKIEKMLAGKTASTAAESGEGIALALESGIAISEKRLKDFLSSLKGAKQIYVSDAQLLSLLRQCLPETKVASIGYSLSQRDALTRELTHQDLYLIEARSYHLDHAEKVAHYDRLRHQQRCHINLDLQRNAIPTTAGHLNTLHPQLNNREQARWILQHNNVARIITECAEDALSLSNVCDLPVLHIADLMEI